MRILFLVLTISLFARIEELAHFHEVEDHMNSDTILILDVDDTLLAPIQMLGSDTWFEYRLKHYLSLFPPKSALEKTLAEWEAIRHLSQMELIEPEIAPVLKALQNQGVSILGITVQGLALATRTVLQLQEQNVDLAKTSPCLEDCCFPVDSHTVLFRQGILFTSGMSKGHSFFELCERIGFSPKRVIAVDDKLKHLESLEKEAERRGVEFIGLRYSFSDVRKEAFSPEIADIQLKYSTLTHILSDDEARAVFQKGENSPPF